MTTDDLRAPLDAAAKATPVAWQLVSHDGLAETWIRHIPPIDDVEEYRPLYTATASPDTVAALARIALAAWEHERVRSTVIAEQARNEGEYDAAINAMLQSRADLMAAIAAAGLLTTAPQAPQEPQP